MFDLSIGTGPQDGALLVVFFLALGVNLAATGVAAQVAVKTRANVKKFMKHGNQLFVEILIEEARQAERHDVEHFPSVDAKALDLVLQPAVMAK